MLAECAILSDPYTLVYGEVIHKHLPKSYTDDEYAQLMRLYSDDYRERTVAEFAREFELVSDIYTGYDGQDENAGFLASLGNNYRTGEFVFSWSLYAPDMDEEGWATNPALYGSVNAYIPGANELTVGERDDIINAVQYLIMNAWVSKLAEGMDIQAAVDEMQNEVEDIILKASNKDIMLSNLYCYSYDRDKDEIIHASDYPYGQE